MTIISKTSFFIKTLRSLPLILLFFSVLNQGDFNYLNVKYFSFNFPFILIFFCSLKKSEYLGNELISRIDDFLHPLHPFSGFRISKEDIILGKMLITEFPKKI